MIYGKTEGVRLVQIILKTLILRKVVNSVCSLYCIITFKDVKSEDFKKILN